MDSINSINNRNDLADFLKIPRSKLTHILYVNHPNYYYKTFTIPKSSGGERLICAPTGDLKSVQEKLAVALCEHQNLIQSQHSINNISHAFTKGKSTITNALIHRNKRYVLNIDLEDFFPSIHFGRVLGYFENNKYFSLPHEVSVVLAQLTCYKGYLPQGAPTSPIISNLICNILDIHILKIAKMYKLDYSRYADDLTFSTNWSVFLNHFNDFLSDVETEIVRSGFKINNKKTRIAFKDSHQEVTGLTVNKKINVPRSFYKETKAMAHSLYTNGYFFINGVSGTLSQLEGRFSYIDQLNKFNNKIDRKKHTCHNLTRREKEYQAFLFYKYFFSNNRPLIITEGKTDIVYLKAALKSLHSDYPELVQKNNEGDYSFNISFFHRSPRWKYFFGVSLDGADSITSLFRFFIGNNAVNYYQIFTEKYHCSQKQAVILLFDNEMNSDRPLKKFVDLANLTNEKKSAFIRNQYLKLFPDSKLFLLTCPLIEGRTECEIEDLLPKEVLSISINNKTFSRKSNYDKNRFFGKEILSSYVYSKYDSIDFSGFIPLFDRLRSIIQESTTHE